MGPLNVKLIAVLCFLAASVNAQTTFTGEMDDIWENSANWSNGIPYVGNDAIIPAGLLVLIEGGYVSEDEIEFNIFNYGRIANYGVVHNKGAIFNYGDLENHSYSSLLNVSNEGVIINYGTFGCYGNSSSQSSGTFINYGDLENYTEFSNGGVLYNSETGHIKNSVVGELTNFQGADIFNEGTMQLQGGEYNLGDIFSCEGEIIGTVSNNPPITQNCLSFSFGSSEVYVIDDLIWPCDGEQLVTAYGTGLSDVQVLIDQVPVPIISQDFGHISFLSLPLPDDGTLDFISQAGIISSQNVSYDELTISSENTSGLSCSGGEEITLLGSGLCEAEIFIDGQPIPLDPISSSNLIRFNSPPGVGVKQLFVTSPFGSQQLLLSYARPFINTILPSEGLFCQGGETITLLGSNLCEVQLFVGGQQIPIIESDANSVTFNSPIGYGEQDVIVTNPSGYARTLLTYGKPEVYDTPSLSDLMCTGGQVIELMGINLCEAEVVVDGQLAYILNSSPNSITFITPPGSGVNDVLVTSPSGTDRILLSYGGPSVDGVAFPGGPNLLCAGGQEIILTGWNLCDAEVFVAGQSLPIVSSGLTFLRCITPPGMGEMDVLIINPSGSDYIVLTYGGISVDSIVPVSEGSICEEGTDFIITGINLCEARVYIGDQEIPVLYSSIEEMRICVPSGLCDENVLIQSQSGSVWSTLSNDIPTVTSITQSSGLPCAGGAILSLFGVGLCNANVFIDGNEVSLTSNSNSSFIEVILPQGFGQSELVVYKGNNEVFSTWLEYELTGCTDSFACNYNPAVACDDGSCEYITCAGCTYIAAPEYNPDSTIDDGSCSLSVISTCPADLNNDLIINTADLLFLLDGFGTTCN